jgi:hypothetical protein
MFDKFGKSAWCRGRRINKGKNSISSETNSIMSCFAASTRLNIDIVGALRNRTEPSTLRRYISQRHDPPLHQQVYPHPPQVHKECSSASEFLLAKQVRNASANIASNAISAAHTPRPRGCWAHQLLSTKALISDQPPCFLARILSSHYDFYHQKSAIANLIEERGHKYVFLPKLHCELNPIEMYWGYAKARYRQVKRNSF